MRKNQLYILVTVASLAGWLWVLWNLHFYNAHQSYAELILCPFRLVTGYPCPSCGSTHALMLLAGRHPAAALYANPFGYVLAAAMLVCPLWVATDLVQRRQRFYLFYSRFEGFVQRRWVTISLIFVVALNWLWNLYKYSL